METKPYTKFFFLPACVAAFAGCTTVTVYQTPVAQFQTSVNSANSGISTYLQDVNDVIAKGNLYDEVKAGADWSPKDLNGGIPDNEIQLRLQALKTISDYANALGAMAESKDVANLQQAAITLGTNVNTLSGTINSIIQDPTSSKSTQKLAVDLGDPVKSLVIFFGTLAIEHAQKEALEKAIINGSTNIDTLIEQLKSDMPDFSALIDTSENAIWQGKFYIYKKMLVGASPKDVDGLINQCVSDFDAIQKLRHVQVNQLLDSMENSHKALVVFAKSDKTPKDWSDLAGQINTFASRVQLFNNALNSIQQTVTQHN